MKNLILLSALSTIFAATATAQTIRVNPTGVNVNSQNPTTVFLTFGQIPAGYVPAEAVWCGELAPAAAPAQGLQCRAGTIYGALPARYDRRQPTGNNGLTDIMAIPPSVVRRAYLAAVRGASAGFFYVRRFVSTGGQPDQFVNVTCRMTGGGARVPFALSNVEIKTVSGTDPILYVQAGEKLPAVTAEIQYNGTGRLKGRWEIVQPGEELPAERDLLTEATLPIEQRGTQKKYTEIERFNHFLPPNGKFVLRLENTDRVPTLVGGQHVLLLRIEATDDKESDSDLADLGVGNGVVHSGAVAAFPIPTLKYFVVGKAETAGWEQNALAPLADFDAGKPLVFVWRENAAATIYRLEISDEADKNLISALLPAPVSSYRAPSFFVERFAPRNLFWRVAALDADGKTISQTGKQAFTLR